MGKFGVCVAWVFFVLSSFSFANELGDEFENRVTAMMKEFAVPGLAIGVVQNGKLIYSKGFGVRNKTQPVTEDTLFAIGSTTKAMTATGLGILVDQGKLNWDEPVRNHLPFFKLFNDEATEKTSARDLLTHRVGLPRHDMVWYGSELSRQQLFRRLRFLEPTKPFRQAWQYQNLMYMTAGILGAKVSGSQSWESFTRTALFEPLGMRRSNFSIQAMKADSNHSIPFESKPGGKWKPIAFRNLDAVGPAGSVNSSAKEMARWLLLNLQGGSFEGTRIVSEDTLSEIHKAQIQMRSVEKDRDVQIGHYALGWGVGTFKGRKIVSHNGGIDGFLTNVSFLPDDNIGVVCFINVSSLSYTRIPDMTSFMVYDQLLGLEQTDWYAEFKKWLKGIKTPKTPLPKLADPPLALEAYAGRFWHPAYGKIEVSVSDKVLVVQYRKFPKVEIHHTEAGVFQAMSEGQVVMTVPPLSFRIEQSEASELQWLLEPALGKPIVFKKIGS